MPQASLGEEKLRTLLKYVKPERWLITLALFVKGLGALSELVIPYILSKMIDDIAPTENVALIALWGGVMLACALGALGANIMANRLSAVTSGRITRSLRHDLFDRTVRLSARQTDSFSISSLISRLTSDTYNVNSMLGRLQRMGVRAPILLIGSIIVTLVIDPVLSLVLICTLPFVALTVVIITKKSIPIYTKNQEALDDLVRVGQENINGVRVIRALSKTEHETARFRDRTIGLSRLELRAGKITSLSNPITGLIFNLGLVAILAVGAFRTDLGLTEPGKIIAFLNYFTVMHNAMLGVTRIFVFMSRGAASANRIEEVLLTEPDLPRLPAGEVKENARLIEFENVTFSYNGEIPNLYDLSFALDRGETLGIIGATGSGKSTIINLLLRFYDVDGGRILIEGQDIRSLDLADYRRRIGITFQNDFIIGGTIRENIAFRRELDEAEILSATEDAQAAEFIAEKDGGLDHEVTLRGSNLSGGQKQRLLIARALASSPDILVLDDSSSALDYLTDRNLRAALARREKKSAAIIIAQRVSSIMHADRIIVLDDGRVSGIGTHEELYLTNDEYRSICDIQLGASEGGERNA